MKHMPHVRHALSAAAIVLAMATPALAGPGHSHGHGPHQYSAGSPGDPKKPAHMMAVTMNETDDGRMIYVPSKFTVKKGDQVRFIITNAGKLPHEFVLASAEDNRKHAEEMKKSPEMKHDDPNHKVVQPKQKAEIIWRFDKAGIFEIACLIPGHGEAGMIASVEVK